MAKIGLNNLKYSVLTEASTGATYAGATSFGKAIDCKVAIETNSAELYADDGIAESDYSFKKGTITLTIDEENDSVFSEILGHAIGTDTNVGEMTRTTADVAPYVGLGRILTKMVNGAYKYKVEFLCKVKFKEPSADEKTKGENLEFGTTSVEGTIFPLADGTWSKAKTFDTKEAAVTYLDSLMAEA